MSLDDKDILYPLVINQLVYDGYGVFALSLKKILIPNCETIASNKLLKLVKLGLAVSKYLEDSDWNKDISQIVHAFRPNLEIDSAFFSTPNSSNSQTITSPPQNGSCPEVTAFTPGSTVQPIKLEPGDGNALHFPFNAYPRQWAQVINRSNINFDREIHELPNGGNPTKLFECSLCGKVFNRRDKVKRHLSELHHGIKSYQCGTCSRAFSRNDKLVRHIMTVHQGIKTHPCSSCPSAFSCNDKLARHIMTVHQGIKAFGCAHCSRRFSRRWEYQRHMQLIHPDLAPVSLPKPQTPLTSSHTQSAPPIIPSPNSVQTPSTSSSSTSSIDNMVNNAPVVSTAVSSIAPIPCVPNAVFPTFPIFNGGTSSSGGSYCVSNSGGGSFNMCHTVAAFPSIPFAAHSNSAVCPSQPIAFPQNSPYANYIQPLMKPDTNNNNSNNNPTSQPTQSPNAFPKPFSNATS